MPYIYIYWLVYYCILPDGANKQIIMVNRKVEVYYPDGMNLNLIPAHQKYLKDDYVRFFQGDMKNLANDKTLDGQDLRVALAIISHLSYDNKFTLSHRQLAEQVGIQRPNVTKTVNKLVKKGYLQIIGKQGQQNIYMFNPNVAFKSRAKNLKELKHAWDKQTLPNTQKHPIDTDTDLEPDLEDKLDQKVEKLSEQFGVPQSKVRQIILSLVDQALKSENQEDMDLPY